MLLAQKNHVVQVHYTGKLTNGAIFDSSNGKPPLEFQLGAGQMIPGFEAGVLGMQVGDKKTLQLSSDQAYGTAKPDMIGEFPKDSIPEDFELVVGGQIGVTLSNGQQIPAVIREIRETTLIIDANHPLAGQELIFEVEMISIKTQDEAEKKPFLFE